jgi:lipopolysaccharide/colanic/teichoic acid biosynthesis glycosyltransferase
MCPHRPVVQAALRLRAEEHEDRRPALRVLDEEVFRTMLISERKRADRSNQPLGLLVAADRAPVADSAAMWATVIEAVATVIRGTDTLGWFEWPTAIGAIFPELRSSAAMHAHELETRVRRELDRSLPPEAGQRLHVQFHYHPVPAHADQGCSPIDLLLFPEFRSHNERPLYDAIKRGFDLIGSTMLLILLSPLFLLIAVLAKLKSRGPVFFGQRRIGRMMKPFTMVTFRTRVTPIGRILRSTSLDVLPQLWNVLRGEMSLVGPRPPLPYELEQYKPWHCRRVLEAKPGITGLWQVAGRSRTTFDEMVRLDLRYARTCSLWTDVKIVLATPAAVFSGKRGLLTQAEVRRCQ